MSLHPNHLDDLRKSGLTDATIEAAGIYSEADIRAIRSLLNNPKFPARTGAAMVFPFERDNGTNGYCRIKPDRPRVFRGKPQKYESPKEHPNEIYIPPGTFAVLQNTEFDLLITEGEKKSLRADQDGFYCIGLVGVWGWKEGKKARMLPALQRIAWKGRKVVIVFDSDAADKPEIRDAMNRLAHELTLAGAIVLCVILPGTAEGKVGLDDYLESHGKDGLFKLLAEAVEPSPVDAAEVKADANTMDPAAEVASILEAGKHDGQLTSSFWRGSYLRWSRGRHREVEPEDLKAFVVNRLNDRYVRLRQSDVGNCLMQIQAKTHLSAEKDPPVWLNTNHPDWDPKEVLSCRNGLIHLPSLFNGEEFYHKATPSFFTPASLDFDFDLQAPKPEKWFGFLNQIWPDDPLSIDTLQEWFGYVLLQDTSLQKILMLIGPRRCGKGTIGRVLTALIGPGNVCNPKLSSFGREFGLAPLIGKSLAIISDARLSGRTDAAEIVENLLSISGEDGQTIARKHKSDWSGRLSTRFAILSNELPRMSDASGAFSGRVVLERFTESWYGFEDPGLTAKLLPELPGILLWSAEGWKRLHDRGHFVEPESSKDLHKVMDDLTSPEGAFVRRFCVVGPHEVIRRELYAKYKAWRESEGAKHVTDEAGFGRLLRAVVPGIEDAQRRIEDKRERVYVGIRLKTKAELEIDDD